MAKKKKTEKLKIELPQSKSRQELKQKTKEHRGK